MFCPQCARENPVRNKFCNGCGASLTVATVAPQSYVAPPPPPLKDSKPLGNFSIEPNAGGKNDAKTPSSEIVQDGKAESLSTNVSANGKSFSESKTFSAPTSTAHKTLSKQTTPQRKAQPPETFGDYLSEVESKYRVSQAASQSNKKKHLIIGVSSAALIALISLIGIGWYFMNRSEPEPKTVAESQKTADEKTNINQPPPEMVYVARVDFVMGNNDGDEYSRPAHSVSVKPFFIDKTEVTCAEYKKFVDAAGHQPPSAWQNNNFPPGTARKPVTGVTWDDAVAFARWKNKRLPTEEEWEFAARGTDGRIYPWGNDWKPEMANADKQKNGVRDVGSSTGQSPFGVFDMSGNAWEWTASAAAPYPNGKSFETNLPDVKIIRGGFFGSSKEKATTTFRRAWAARGEKDYNNTGFRCVSDIPAERTQKLQQ